MSNTVVIIPTRLKARRFPNKPLELINGKEMILHVYQLAKNSNVGDVLVVTPDKDIEQLIKKNGGNSLLSLNEHETGTDRVFEAFKKFYSNKTKIIINLQGDMPNLDPKAIVQLSEYMKKEICDLATLASSIKQSEIQDNNVVKVISKNDIKKSGFSEAIDFKRDSINQKDKYIYHHIGIYAFTSQALMRYVNLKRSKFEVERNLEQMRALENKMRIHVGYTFSNPLSVDTEEDLKEVKRIMEKK
mgnify:CR=1 FL=1|tara:strand:- start:396 stop:1130 length:735 start_codon:yes stop_codon:yes gene_type:complete